MYVKGGGGGARVCVRVRVCTCLFLRPFVQLYICTYGFMYVRMYVWGFSVYMGVRMCILLYKCLCYLFICKLISACLQSSMQECIHI